MQTIEIGNALLILGDAHDALREIDEASVHACVTDPPYGLSFMGKDWDHAVPGPDLWEKVRRVLKPGAHLAAFAGTRTQHRMASAIEDSGFDIRDMLAWLYGSGFPKNFNVEKAIDACDATTEKPEDVYRFTAWLRSTGVTASAINKATQTSMGGHYLTAKSQPAIPTPHHWKQVRPLLQAPIPDWVEVVVQKRGVRAERRRENLERRTVLSMHTQTAQAAAWRGRYQGTCVSPPGTISAPFTSEANRWEGWGTALKPSIEPITLARKKFPGTIAGNVLAHGTGAINVDAARVGSSGGTATADYKRLPSVNAYGDGLGGGRQTKLDAGRWPANVLWDGSLPVAEAFPAAVRDALTFYYCAKPGRAEREYGMVSDCSGQHITRRDGGAPGPRGNNHPTVKPIALMRWLCRLITPPGGFVLDPFMGSGTTGIAAIREGVAFVGIERDPHYFEIARRRITQAVQDAETAPDLVTPQAPQLATTTDLFAALQ